MFIIIEIPVFNENSVGHDQTPRSVASDLDLYCFQGPFYGTLGINGLMCRAYIDDLKRLGMHINEQIHALDMSLMSKDLLVIYKSHHVVNFFEHTDDID